MRTFTATAHAEAPPEAVFALLADGARWSEWTFIPRSALVREGTPAPDGVGSIRRFGLAPFVSREEIVEYDPPRRLAYVLRSGLPVRSYRATVDLEPDDRGTRIVWRGELDPYPGTGGAMAAVLRRMVQSFADRAAERAPRRPMF